MTRPKCQVEGCCTKAQNTNTSLNPSWRKAGWVREEFNVEEGYVCAKHHVQKIESMRAGEDYLPGYKTGAEYQEALYQTKIEEAGFSNKEDYTRYINFGNTDWYRAGYPNGTEYQEVLYQTRIKEAGYDNKKAYQKWLKIQSHPYKKYRKTYCENIDGRLGFKCTTTIIDSEWQLDCDHKDGDPSNNSEDNIQTLCKCCHVIKTRDSRDYATPGRTTLKVA